MFKRISGHGEGGRRSGILNTILRAGPRLRPTANYVNLTSRQTPFVACAQLAEVMRPPP